MSILKWKANCPGPEQLRKGGKWEEKPVEQHQDHFLHSNRNTAGEKEARKKTAESSQEPGSVGDTLLLGSLCSFRFGEPTPDLSGPLRQLSWPMSKFPRLSFQLSRSKSKLPWCADHLSTFIFKLPRPMYKIPHCMYEWNWSTCRFLWTELAQLRVLLRAASICPLYPTLQPLLSEPVRQSDILPPSPQPLHQPIWQRVWCLLIV